MDSEMYWNNSYITRKWIQSSEDVPEKDGGLLCHVIFVCMRKVVMYTGQTKHIYKIQKLQGQVHVEAKHVIVRTAISTHKPFK